MEDSGLRLKRGSTQPPCPSAPSGEPRGGGRGDHTQQGWAVPDSRKGRRGYAALQPAGERGREERKGGG